MADNSSPPIVDARTRVPKAVKNTWPVIIIGGLSLITLSALSFVIVSKLTPDSLEAQTHQKRHITVEEAEQFALQYFNHQTAQDALPYTLPDPLISGSMQLFWSPLVPPTKKLRYVTKYSLEGGFDAFYFRQAFDDNSTARKVLVYQSPSGSLYFDWRSYMGIQDIDITKLKTINLNQSVLIRARVEFDTYYNFGYNEEDWQSLKLSNPNYSRMMDHKTFAFIDREALPQAVSLEGKTILLKVIWTGKIVEVEEVFSSRPVSYTLNHLVIPHFKRLKAITSPQTLKK